MEDEVEQTLHVSRSVDVYQIPPRAPSGFKSGEWLVSAKIFTGRMRVVSKGTDCTIRLEDPNTDELFAACPIAYGMRNICVEAATDSSRYFVLRVEDPATKRHAFLGVGFAQRGEAFDFNDALVRHEKFVEREKACSQITGGAGAGGAAGAPQDGLGTKGSIVRSTQPSIQAVTAAKEVASLYHQIGDLSIKEGQTIHVNVKPTKPANGTAGGPAGGSWLTSSSTQGGPAVVPVQGQTATGLFKLAPPPADAQATAAVRPSKPAAASPQGPPTTQPAAQAVMHTPAATGMPDLLGLDSKPAAAPSQLQADPKVAAQQTDWAVFD